MYEEDELGFKNEDEKWLPNDADRRKKKKGNKNAKFNEHRDSTYNQS